MAAGRCEARGRRDVVVVAVITSRKNKELG
jgi:hypothetical protein